MAEHFNLPCVRKEIYQAFTQEPDSFFSYQKLNFLIGFIFKKKITWIVF